MGGVPLALIFFHTLGMVYVASTISGTGYRSTETPRSFGENATTVSTLLPPPVSCPSPARAAG